MGESEAPGVTVVPGGPMLVRGVLLSRLRHDGTAWELDPIETAGASFALCRCGRSGAMPFCDRPAPYACFDEEAPSGPEPSPFHWDVPDPAAPAVALKPDGPVRVSGGVPVTHGDRTLPPVDRVSLCRCAASRCQPYCDSSHKIAGYRG